MNKKKIISLTAGVIIVAGAAIWLFGGSSRKQQVTYEMVKVGPADISNFVTATGTIEPVTEVEVGTQVSGIIDKIYVDYNTIVKEGQLIALMDKVTLESELASSQATYDGAKAEYEYQKKNYERNKGLKAKNLISDTDYEQSEYNYLKAKSTFDSSKAALAKAERNLSYATITSPIDGVVIIAADLTQMQVVADVDEADIGGVELGQRVEFTVDAYPNDTFQGEVTQIRLGEASSSTSTTSSTTVVTYEVVISAPNPDLKLKPRLTANITIYTLDKRGVNSVPAAALRFTPARPIVGADAVINDCEGEHKLWTKEGNVFTAHPVSTGISNGSYTEITGGIEAGTEVICEANITRGAQPEAELEAGERSPFMPGPPGNDKKKSSSNGKQ